MVNSQSSVKDVVGRHHPWCLGWEDELRALFGAYVQEKQAQHVLDYDDLLLFWHQAMQEPSVAAAIGGRFDHVLVDEYQDTNRLQAAIVHALKPDGRGLTVVGDDAQSIYAFCAAEVRNILDFPVRFDPPARVITLERNYRSTAPILEASNAVIGLSRERYTKHLWTDRASSDRPALVTVDDEMAQARWVADEVYLILSTMHSAKGQEWTAVTVLNAVDGCIPSDMATGSDDEIEEERRLLYVAMTRAKRHLSLVVPLRFHVTQQGRYGDRHMYGNLTRFIPAALSPLFDRPRPPEGRAETAIAPLPKVSDVFATARRMAF